MDFLAIFWFWLESYCSFIGTERRDRAIKSILRFLVLDLQEFIRLLICNVLELVMTLSIN
jgi:hypothetical protein